MTTKSIQREGSVFGLAAEIALKSYCKSDCSKDICNALKLIGVNVKANTLMVNFLNSAFNASSDPDQLVNGVDTIEAVCAKFPDHGTIYVNDPEGWFGNETFCVHTADKYLCFTVAMYNGIVGMETKENTFFTESVGTSFEFNVCLCCKQGLVYHTIELGTEDEIDENGKEIEDLSSREQELANKLRSESTKIKEKGKGLEKDISMKQEDL